MALCHHAQAFLWHCATIPYKAFCQYAVEMSTPDKKPLVREADKFIIRLPEGMRDKIMDAAAANNRSMNAEIVARLLASFDSAHQMEGADLDELAGKLAERLAPMLNKK